MLQWDWLMVSSKKKTNWKRINSPNGQQGGVPKQIIQSERDRQSLDAALESCIDPMDPDSNAPGCLLNIANVQLAQTNVNVDRVVGMGLDRLQSSVYSGLERFAQFSAMLLSSDREKEAPQNWEEHRPESCDDIYHIIGLCISQRHLDGQQVLVTELTSYTPAMCHADGSIRLSTGKSTLKKTQLQVEVSQHSWVFHQQLYLWFWVYLLCSGLSHEKCMEVLMHSCKPLWHKFQATTKVRHILKFWPLLTLFYEYQHQSNRWQLLELIKDSSNTIVK